jgi:hypothetical protein
LLESEVYELLPTDSAAKIERKVQKLLSKHKTALPTGLKHEQIPHHSRPPHLYIFPKGHEPNIPPRPIESSIGWFLGWFPL